MDSFTLGCITFGGVIVIGAVFGIIRKIQGTGPADPMVRTQAQARFFLLVIVPLVLVAIVALLVWGR